jgi:hypothetical protein
VNRFDITQTNAAVERLIETTENPRHLYLLHAYNRHRYLEMAGRFEEIFTPESLGLVVVFDRGPPAPFSSTIWSPKGGLASDVKNRKPCPE